MNKQICVVCFANYCRSPVAQVILSKLHPKINVISAGLKPIPKANMDERSASFLNKNNYSFEVHNPKSISDKIMNESNLVYAIDHFILMSLNRQFPNHSKKIKLLTHQSPQINLADPYTVCDDEYWKIMKKIEMVCSAIELEM